MKNSLVKSHTRKRKNGVTVVKKHKRSITSPNAYPDTAVKINMEKSSKAPMNHARTTKKATVKKVASIKSTMKTKGQRAN